MLGTLVAMILALKSSFMLIAAFQFLFLSLFLFLNKKGLRTSSNLFALFLLGKGIILSFNILLAGGYLESGFYLSFVQALYFPMLFFYSPFLFLYIKSSTESTYRFRSKDLAHLIPSLFLLLIGVSGLGDLLPTRVLNAAYYVQAVSYTTGALLVLRHFKKEAHQLSSQQRITQTWLHVLMGGFMLIMVTFFTAFCLSVLQVSTPTLDSAFIAAGLFLLFLFANGIVYNSLRHPTLFSQAQHDANLAKRSPLPKAVNRKTAKELEALMEQEQLYLDPKLRAKDVAERLHIHPRTLSLVLSQLFQQNFSDFVNGYRIRKAQHLISTDLENKTLLEILLVSGFNSKSVFNAAFKKHTGMTPSVYKKMVAPKELVSH